MVNYQCIVMNNKTFFLLNRAIKKRFSQNFSTNVVMNCYTIILARRFVFSGNRGCYSTSNFSFMSKQISKHNFQGSWHDILSDQKERPPEKVKQTNKAKLYLNSVVMQLKMSPKSSTNISTSRGKHLTGFLTQESVCSVGLKAAWVDGVFVTKKNPSTYW